MRTIAAITLGTALAIVGWLNATSGGGESIPIGARAIALASHPGDSATDRRIHALQQRIADGGESRARFEALGWAYVEKARGAADPGFYRLAESCAEVMAELGGSGPDAWLLRGHARLSLHDFPAAEGLARRAVDARGNPFDHALLGDVLLDTGRLEEAASHYQRMVDLRPDSHALIRAARVRYLTGDVEGAAALAEDAARAASPRDPESLAWIWAQHSLYQLALGDVAQAVRSARRGAELAPNSADALEALGRSLLATGAAEESADALGRAATMRPLPELLRWHAEALRAANRPQRAARVEAEILRSGPRNDARGAALFLAEHSRDPERALRLAEQELAVRQDAYTWDAVAWARRAAGQLDAASNAARAALTSGIRDPRVHYHAGAIAQDAGAPRDAEARFREARRATHLLLPSERLDLKRRSQQLFHRDRAEIVSPASRETIKRNETRS